MKNDIGTVISSNKNISRFFDYVIVVQPWFRSGNGKYEKDFADDAVVQQIQASLFLQ